MSTLLWIVAGGLAMSAIALVGAFSFLLRAQTLDRLLLPLVALAAGTMLGSAFFHMIPKGYAALTPLGAGVWLVAGFAFFLALEQFLHWHHSHRAAAAPRPVAYLVLAGDAVHNFLDGIGVASTFLIDPRAGIVAWLAAAAHEIPQELGDFGVLVHSGWSRRRALLWNLASAMTFPVGAVLAYVVSWQVDVSGLMLLGAGSFIYIAASDLIPEIKSAARPRDTALHFACFVAGLLGMLVLACGLG